MARALSDPVFQVRLRAADLVTAGCADSGITAILFRWLDRLPDPPPGASRDLPTLLAGAHALVGIARLDPGWAQVRTNRYSSHRTWQVRVYAARAARLRADTNLLRLMTADADGNVAEAALEGLSALAGHSQDSVYRRVLERPEPQAVRAAAIALKGSTDPATRPALHRALRRWLARPNDSERDVRLALLDAAGRPAADDRRWSTPAPLPRDAVALALGADRRLKVTMEGGSSFVIKLRGDVAPITGARVLALARSRYYDGTVWHRVVSDFVLQGGGHGANEYVGHPRFFRDELGNVSHLRGGVGMSTRGHDTGDAQWFIDLGDNQRLDKDYTLFGEVVEGMDVVDAVLEGARIATIRSVR